MQSTYGFAHRRAFDGGVSMIQNPDALKVFKFCRCQKWHVTHDNFLYIEIVISL